MLLNGSKLFSWQSSVVMTKTAQPLKEITVSVLESLGNVRVIGAVGENAKNDRTTRFCQTRESTQFWEFYIIDSNAAILKGVPSVP